MSDKDIPEIPSFEELGLSAEEVEALEREMRGEGDAPAAAGDSHPTSGSAKPDSATGSPGAAGGSHAAARSPDATAGSPAAKEPPRRKRSWFRRGGDGARVPAEPPPPRRPATPLTWAAPAILLLMAWASSSARIPPRPAEANAPSTAFSEARARTHLDRIGRAAHPPGSPEHAAVRAYLVDVLGDLGYEPSVQTATSLFARGDVVRAATVRNVLARIPGSASTGAVLITAHYDGRGIAPAAGDDGVGVSVILEALRALRAGPALRNDIIVLLTDGEELGLLGARAFVDEHAWLDDVAVVLSFEMRGGGGPALMFETGPDNGWIIAALDAAVDRPAANSASYEIYQRLPNDTDFTPFREAGKQGLNFAAIGNAHVYHQAYDVPANVAGSTVQHHGDQALALLRHLGAADLIAVNGPDVTYFSVPVLGLVSYGRIWIWVVGLVVALGWGVAVWAVRQRGARILGLAAGALAGLTTIAASAGLGSLLFAWRSSAHPEWGALHGSAFHAEGWYVLALAAGAMAIALAVLGFLRRWVGAPELAVGALLPVVLGALAATIWAPLAAANLQWPALAGTLAVLGLSRAGPDARFHALRWLLPLGSAVVALALLVPLSELTWLALSLAAAPVIGGMLGMLATLLVPALEPAALPRRWVPPVVAALAAGAFLVVGISGAAPSAERPAPSTLLYTMDRAAGTARWATHGARPATDPGVAWARGQVGEPTERASLRGYLLGDRPYALVAADPIDVPTPEIVATPDSGDAGAVVRVAIRSRIGAEAVLVDLDGVSASLLAVNGEPVPTADRVRFVDHWGTPAGAIELTFSRGFRDEPLRFTVAEHLLRPAEIVDPASFRRPAELAPDIRQASDRAVLRSNVRVDPATGAIEGVDVGGSAPSGLPGAPADSAAPPTPDAPPSAAADSTRASSSADSTRASSSADSARVSPSTTDSTPPSGSP